ncbi:hypothetical protein Esti_003574 [Eimeria stiedai]
MDRTILLLLLLLLLVLPTPNLPHLLRTTCLQQQQQRRSAQQQQRCVHVHRSSSSSRCRCSKGLLAFIRCPQSSLPATAETAAAAASAAAAAAASTGGARPLIAAPSGRPKPRFRAAGATAAAAAAGTESAGRAAAAAGPPSAAAAAAAAAAAGTELGQCVRPLFPLLSSRKRFVPFDNAATTHKPRSVIDAEVGVYRHLNANIHRGAYRLAAAATEAVETVREKLARFVGGEPEEIVFTAGATAAINMVARAWGDAYVEAGSELVVSVAEHHANLVPWQQLAKRKNAKLRFIPLHKSSRELDIKGAMGQLSARTRVLAVACVSNVLGAFVKQQQLRQLLRCAKSQHQDLVTLVDATQALQHAQMNARELGADFLVASGHKMYGSTGVGFLWGRKEVLQRMPPDNFGGEMIQRVQLSSSTFTSLPWRFEAGTLPIAQIVGLGAAVEFLQDVGLPNIAAAETRLSRLLREAVNDLPRVRILSVHPQQQQRRKQQQQQQGGEAAAAAEETVPICSFVIEGLSSFDLAVCSDQWHNIHLRAGHHCAQPLHEEILKVPGSLRASLAVYNTEEEIYRFHHAMLKTIKRLDSVIAGSLKPKPTAAAASAMQEQHRKTRSSNGSSNSSRESDVTKL